MNFQGVYVGIFFLDFKDRYTERVRVRVRFKPSQQSIIPDPNLAFCSNVKCTITMEDEGRREKRGQESESVWGREGPAG